MKAIKNWENVQAAGNFESLPAGGYVCEIMSAKEKPNRNNGGTHLEIMFDVSEGPDAGFFTKDYRANTREDKFWRGVVNQNIPDEASPKYETQASFFKRFIANIEESNPGYHWDWDEGTLKGKKIGVIFGEREKQSQRGTVYIVTYADSVTTVEAIRTDDFSVPPLKQLESGRQNATPSWVAEADSANDADLPF